MKDMQQSGGNNMFGSMPELHNVIINVNNDLVNTILIQNPRQKRKVNKTIPRSCKIIKLELIEG